MAQEHTTNEEVFGSSTPCKADFDVPYVPEIDEFKDDPYIFE